LNNFQTFTSNDERNQHFILDNNRDGEFEISVDMIIKKEPPCDSKWPFHFL